METITNGHKAAAIQSIQVCKWDFAVWYAPDKSVYLLRGQGKEPQSFKDGKVRLTLSKDDLQSEFGTVRRALELIAANNGLKMVKKLGPPVEIGGLVGQDPLFIFC